MPHRNWVTVGEIIRLIQTCVASYADHIVKRWHMKLCKDLTLAPCANPSSCFTKKKAHDLCHSCKRWHQELALSHRNTYKSKIKWRQNCDTSKWPVDAWEVAKFFMPPLGDSKNTVKDAPSTDLASLLNVIEWMENVAFRGDRRVDLNLVKDLRSEVRNAWAHSPNHETTDEKLKNAFEIATKFLADLKEVFGGEEIEKCLEEIKLLQDNGLTNVRETEEKQVLLLAKELWAEYNQTSEEIKNLKQDRNSDKEKLMKLESFREECSAWMENFQRWKDSLQDDMNKNKLSKTSKLESRIPEQLAKFTGRDNEVQEIISFLVERKCGVVSIVGGPGFGKTSIAVKVCRLLNEKHDIPVVFSYLLNASTVDEVIQRLCLDVGVHPEEDPKSSLTFWLRNIKAKVVLVMDNIEQLLEAKVKPEFYNILRCLRKDSGQRLQILTTSRTTLHVSDLNTERCFVKEMDSESSVELLKKYCPEKELEKQYLIKMADLCGHVPLALHLLGYRLKKSEDLASLIEWLKDTPMEVLQTPDEKVRNTIEKSFEILNDEEKRHFVRLSVFGGDFNGKTAQHVIALNQIKTENILDAFEGRSLLQRSGGNYSIHLLIRNFLVDQKELVNDRRLAQELMVKHYLTQCHRLTQMYWSKGGFNEARKALKEDSHNVERVLKICEEASNAATYNQTIVDTLITSDIYHKFSSRYFYNFIRHLLSPTTVGNFLECCAKLAKNRKDANAEINFQCLLADEKGRMSEWKSNEYLSTMESLKNNFDESGKKLPLSVQIKGDFYYYYGRYRANQNRTDSGNDLLWEAKCYIQKSLQLRQRPRNSPFKALDEVVTLQFLGQLNKMLNEKELAEEKLKSAVEISKKYLGDHELTSTAYKKLGDLYMKWIKNEEALKCYDVASEILERLGLDNPSISSFRLLKNRGLCLLRQNRTAEAIKDLKEARDLVEKLPQRDMSGEEQVYTLLATALDKLEVNRHEAAEFAQKALDINDPHLGKNRKKKLIAIVNKTKENSLE